VNAPAPAGTGNEKARRRLIPPLLRDTAFRRYWSPSTVSMAGDQVASVAVPLTAVLALHAGASTMGYLTVGSAFFPAPDRAARAAD
jgi:hypothetical protein